MRTISHDNLFHLLDKLTADYRVFAPIKRGDQRFYKPFEGEREGVELGEVRAFEPLKAFLWPAREEVARDFSPESPHSENKPLCIVGVKACDIKGYKVQDFVFADHEPADPTYARTRSQNLIISADCTCAIDTCFCLALGIQPYPREDFDLNLSRIEGGWLVEEGSEKGARLVEDHASLFSDAHDEQKKERDALRNRTTEQVQANIEREDTPAEDALEGVVAKGFESDIWEDESRTCVECGACNTICPTCHCFLLYDQVKEGVNSRYRVWDSCLLKDFARVAGGANPRPKLWERLRNRFEKKFDFFPKVADVYACTGCGRCISACPARIDIRRVLKRLVEYEPQS